MKDNITLGEMKARCLELNGKFGDNCCDQCEYAEIGCCDPPDSWKLEKATEYANVYGVPEEEYLRKEEELKRLRTIVSTVETMLGRKFEV